MYTREQWEQFTNEEIDEMDEGALGWWKQWRQFVLLTSKELDKVYKEKETK